MKYELRPCTLGILNWLSDTRKNPAITGKGTIGFPEMCEMFLPFIRPLEELEAMDDEEAKQAARDLMNELDAESFRALEGHAEREILAFTSTATVPKKRSPLPERILKNASLWERIKARWFPFLCA